MGRTMHYSVTGSLTDKQKEWLHNFTLAVNSKPEIWTCESFRLDPYDYHANWQCPQFKYMRGSDTAHSIIDGKMKELMAKGFTHLEAVKFLHDTGLISYYADHHEDKSLSSFTKVGGNELNAMMVFYALITASRYLKNKTVTVCDEGEFLLCELTIKNGLVKPDAEACKENWDYWASQDYLKDDKGLLAKKAVQQKLIADYPDYVEPHLLHRAVNPADFQDHPEYGLKQIMSGFHGEYYGMAKNDAESESYKMLGMITGMLKATGLKDLKIKAAHPINS